VAVAVCLGAVVIGRHLRRGIAISLPYVAPPGILLLIHAVSYFRERKYSLPRDAFGTTMTAVIVLGFLAAIVLAAVVLGKSKRNARLFGVLSVVALIFWGAMRVRTASPIGVEADVAPRAESDRLIASETGQRVLLLGLDGITWEILDPMMAEGRTPNLALLASRGRTFALETIRPTFSPVIWTSVATGKDRFQHGIHDVVQTVLFGRTRLHRSLERTAFCTKTARVALRALKGSPWHSVAPYRSSEIRATTIFEAASEALLSSTQIEWYVTWPAKPLSGVSISDRFHLQDPQEEPMPGAVNPMAIAPHLMRHVVTGDDIPLERVCEFVDMNGLTPSEARRWTEEHAKFVNEMRLNLSRDMTTRNVARDLLSRDGDWRLFGIYFRAVDLAHHFTWNYRDGQDVPTSDPNARLAPVIARYHEFVDQIVGELLAEIPQDTIVIALSDHGFEDRFAHARAPEGFAIVAGGPTVATSERGRLSIYEIAPTIAMLLGLPVADDLVGDPREDLFDPDFVSQNPPRTVATWDWEGRAPMSGAMTAEAAVEQAEIERLRALGYIQ
jgi:hypothetical protein